MKTINLKRIVVAFYAIVITAALFAGLNYGSEGRAIHNEEQIADLFEHATTCYEYDGNFDYAFDEMNRGLQAAFQEGSITSANVENVVTVYCNAGGSYKKLMEAYIPTMQANGWVSSSFSVGSTSSTNSQTNNQTASTPSNTSEVTESETSESTTMTSEENNKTENDTNLNETEDIKTKENTTSDEEWTESERVESTCTEAGYVVYTNASGEEKTEELPLAEHQYVETSRTAATCTETGSINYTCEVCGDTYSEEIPTIDHLLVEETTEAGLFSEGSVVTKCSICGEVISEESIPAKCPIWVAIVVFVMIIGFIVGIVHIAKAKKGKI